MKKNFFSMIVAVIAIILTTGCSAEKQREAKNENASGIDVVQTTLQHKQDAYRLFSPKGLEGYFETDAEGKILNFAKFLEDLGLKYRINESTIILAPNVEYDEADDFEYVLDYEDDVICGDHRYQGRHGTIWQTADSYESAADFVFRMALENKIYLIGGDELGIMYRNLRLYTAPADKIDEISAEIDEELVSK